MALAKTPDLEQIFYFISQLKVLKNKKNLQNLQNLRETKKNI
jgi:hypothetical protein